MRYFTYDFILPWEDSRVSALYPAQAAVCRIMIADLFRFVFRVTISGRFSCQGNTIRLRNSAVYSAVNRSHDAGCGNRSGTVSSVPLFSGIVRFLLSLF